MATECTVAMVRLSDSFAGAVSALVAETGATAPPAGASADLVLLLAGGAESDALAWLDAAPATGERRLVIGALPDHRLAAAAVQRGASDYLVLPGDLDLLRRTVERAVAERRAAGAAQQFAAEERRANGFDAILGESEALRQTLATGRRVARHADVTVLIGGETGTGKELLARALHYESPRAAAPFVEINCTAIPAQLLESELFGHEKGSFTGATSATPGLLESAHGGTVFLDEIGHLPLDLQPKLLRALETRQIRRVGAAVARTIDVRLVAASHVDLAQAVRRGEFREDLYYRLNVVALVLPPLRERPGDVRLLAAAFATHLATRYGLPVPTLGPAVVAALEAHDWPGNVRELRNAIERALVLSPPGTLDVAELPRPHAAAAAPAAPAIAAGQAALPFPAELAQIQRAAAQAMLDLTGGNKSDAARRLNISRPRLQRLLDGHDDA